MRTGHYASRVRAVHRRPKDHSDDHRVYVLISVQIVRSRKDALVRGTLMDSLTAITVDRADGNSVITYTYEVPPSLRET